MKNFLHRLFGLDGQGCNEENLQVQLRPLSIHSLHDHQRRAMIGWLANRMGETLQTNSDESGSLIYMAFYKDCTDASTDNVEDYLIYLASCLYDWIAEREDVYLHIKEQKFPDHHHENLLAVYEQVKEDMQQYFPQKPDKSYDRSEDDKLWEVYRDVIHAATQKKFLLIKEDTVNAYKQGIVVCDEIIAERSDIPKVRNAAKSSLISLGLSTAAVMEKLLLISEAITNTLKHANGGKLLIVQTETAIHVLVEDSGPGFALKILPYTTLMAGYSTKKSLGQGFTLMMKMADQVLLSTVPNHGSTLILVFKYEKGGQRNEQSSAV